MAIDINNGLPLQKHFLDVLACSQASSESLQRTNVLIITFTLYQIGEKAQHLRKYSTLENPIWQMLHSGLSSKEHGKCMHA